MSDIIKHDLELRIHERLRRWVKDSEQLFDAGDISPDEARASIIIALATGLSVMVVDTDTSPRTAGDLVEALVAVARRERKAAFR